MRPRRRQWLLGACALMLPLRAAWSQTARVPTVTRLVKMFLDLESQLAQASRAGDATTLQRLLADDFEMRVARQPGTPTARAEWLAAVEQQPPGETSIEQMAVHERGTWAEVSFLMRPAASGKQAPPPLFIVDTWQREGDTWRLAVRYASPLARTDQRVPGESAAPVIQKKY